MTLQPTMSSPTQHKAGEKTSALLTLPAELRNNIYQILLVAPHPFQLGLEDNDCRHVTVRVQNWYEAPPSANILATSKQINREANAYLYGDNTFTFQQDPRALSAFLARIKKSALLVRKINVANSFPKTFATMAIKALQHAPNLMKLEIAYVPSFVHDVNVMAELLLPWAKAALAVASADADWMGKLGGLRFCHVASTSDRAGSSFGRPRIPDITEVDKVAEEYTDDVKARLLRLIKVKRE